MLHWHAAVLVARTCEDVTYQEWCWLYVDISHPTQAQFEKASATAKTILIRNKAIDPGVQFEGKFNDRWIPSGANV